MPASIVWSSNDPNATPPPNSTFHSYPSDSGYSSAPQQSQPSSNGYYGAPAPFTQRVAPIGQGEDSDGLAYIQETLRDYGFSEAEAAELTQWARGQLVEGASPTIVRQRLWEQPTFKRRFKVIFDRRDRGMPPISPAEVIAFERGARQLMRGAGLPPGFYDSPDDYYNFMLNDVSLSELAGRVEMAKTIMYSVDQTTRAEMKRLYGFNEGQEVAYILDGTRALPIIQNQFNAAILAGAAAGTGFGRLSRTEAEQFSLSGLTSEQAKQGFGNLVQSKELFLALPGQAENAIGRADQLGATFTGDALAQERIRRRAEARVAAFQGGGSFAASQEGFRGLGSAST